MGLPDVAAAYEYLREKFDKARQEYDLDYDGEMWILLQLINSCHLKHIAGHWLEPQKALKSRGQR